MCLWMCVCDCAWGLGGLLREDGGSGSTGKASRTGPVLVRQVGLCAVSSVPASRLPSTPPNPPTSPTEWTPSGKGSVEQQARVRRDWAGGWSGRRSPQQELALDPAGTRALWLEKAEALLCCGLWTLLVPTTNLPQPHSQDQKPLAHLEWHCMRTEHTVTTELCTHGSSETDPTALTWCYVVSIFLPRMHSCDHCHLP